MSFKVSKGSSESFLVRRRVELGPLEIGSLFSPCKIKLIEELLLSCTLLFLQGSEWGVAYMRSFDFIFKTTVRLKRTLFLAQQTEVSTHTWCQAKEIAASLSQTCPAIMWTKLEAIVTDKSEFRDRGGDVIPSQTAMVQVQWEKERLSVLLCLPFVVLKSLPSTLL